MSSWGKYEQVIRDADLARVVAVDRARAAANQALADAELEHARACERALRGHETTQEAQG